MFVQNKKALLAFMAKEEATCVSNRKKVGVMHIFLVLACFINCLQDTRTAFYFLLHLTVYTSIMTSLLGIPHFSGSPEN